MTPKLEEILGTQPNSVDINPQVLALLGQFGNRVERLTARTLSVEERKIVDARLCTLALDLRDSA